MKLLNGAAAAVAAAAVLCVAACGGHASGSGLSVLPQPPDESHGTKPGPAPMQTFAPNAFFADTTDGIHAIQIFDDINGNVISVSQAKSDGGRYGAVWGSRQATVIAWQTNNPSNRPLLYTPFDTDVYGAPLGHDLQWWQINHPDWILYECNKKTVAYVPGLPEVPLDISNPAVAAYQAAGLGAYAELNGYNGISADIVDLTNNTGHAKSGAGGCGVWSTPATWVQKFSGQYVDPQWAAAVAAWAATLQPLLHAYPRSLALAVNTPPGRYTPPQNGIGGDPVMRSLFDHVDIELDEAGFAMWGMYVNNVTFTNIVGWIEYVQSQGKAFLVADNWNQQSGDPTLPQLDYSLATYMMGKEQASALYVGKNSMYGKENYYSEYDTAIGHGCSPMYGGPNDPRYPNEKIYLRKYTNSLAIVNVSPTASYQITLPKRSYTNIEGGKVYSPLTVGPNTGYVLLTTNGCAL